MDQGQGTIDVFRIEDKEPVKIDESLEGKFYAGDSYIVKHTYMKGTKEHYTLYFWLGAQSTTDEKGAAALDTWLDAFTDHYLGAKHHRTPDPDDETHKALAAMGQR